MNISGKSVLVTGAASGIGKATAMAMAAERPDGIIACDIDERGLMDTVAALVACGCDAIGLVIDITNLQSVEGAIADAVERFGRVDILVNAAGIGMMGRMESLTTEDWRRVIDINLWGTINVNRAVYPEMLARGTGHIVNVASANGIYAPIPYLSPYVTSKFGVVGLSEALMVEGRPRGIRVTCICPGNVRTPIYDKAVFRGFNEGARTFTKMNRLIAEEPHRTAEQIVKAIRKNRFIVVTTWFARLCAFARTHFQAGWFAYTRGFTMVSERLMKRYRED
jgi:NAD(P)-dependent dehydrogenase (short-subunit alcohol dehydrogenase family)